MAAGDTEHWSSKAARICLAGVFLASAVGKAASPRSFVDDIGASLSVQPAMALLLGLALLAAELAAAALLARRRTASLGAAWAALLSAAFLLHRLGARPNGNAPCNCFGVFGGLTPAEGLQLNAAMLAVSLGLFLATAGVARAPRLHWPSHRQAALACVGLGAAVAAGGYGARAVHGTDPVIVQAAVSKVRFGSVLPAVGVTDAHGRLCTLAAGNVPVTLLLFVKPSCRMCDRLVMQLAQTGAQDSDRVRVTLVVHATAEASPSESVAHYAGKLGFGGKIAFDRDGALQSACFGPPLAWPSAVALDADGVVRQVLAVDELALGSLAQTVTATAVDLPFAAEGATVPRIAYRRRPPSAKLQVGGRSLGLADVLGPDDALVSVMAPDCGACLATISYLGRRLPDRAVRVVLVASSED